jgi:hypothetical protein
VQGNGREGERAERRGEQELEVRSRKEQESK